MRVFALSDIHVDYAENMKWIRSLSTSDYRDDVLLLAGDVSDLPVYLEEVFGRLSVCFEKVLFVPGNHDLWIRRCQTPSSLEKFALVRAIAHDCGVSTSVHHRGAVSMVPLLSWYDYSFGPPNDALREVWMDYRACYWPGGLTDAQITRHFLSLNTTKSADLREVVISFSHFLPRLDLMPDYIPVARHYLYPVLGTWQLDEKVRAIRSTVHVYGHSHVNREVKIAGIRYVNNAFGYPSETWITKGVLKCVYDSHWDAEQLGVQHSG